MHLITIRLQIEKGLLILGANTHSNWAWVSRCFTNFFPKVNFNWINDDDVNWTHHVPPSPSPPPPPIALVRWLFKWIFVIIFNKWIVGHRVYPWWWWWWRDGDDGADNDDVRHRWIHTIQHVFTCVPYTSHHYSWCWIHAYTHTHTHIFLFLHPEYKLDSCVDAGREEKK